MITGTKPERLEAARAANRCWRPRRTSWRTAPACGRTGEPRQPPRSVTFLANSAKELYNDLGVGETGRFLGYGHSSHPNGLLVTLDSQAALRCAPGAEVRQDRREAIPPRHPGRPLYGTATSWLESAEFNDADAVIGTGWASDPKTAPEVGSDPNYFTPPPSGRAQNYLYDLSNVDPNVINYDINRLRDSVTHGEGSTFTNRYSDLTTGLLGRATSR